MARPDRPGGAAAVLDAQRALQDDQGVLVAGPQRQRGPAARQRQVGTQVVGVAAGRRLGPRQLADQHGGDGAADRRHRQLGMVLERGRPVAGLLRLGHPELDALGAPGRRAGRRLLGVGDAAAGGHEVELAGADELLGTEAVAVQHLAVEQPRHRLQGGVRVRADVEPRAAPVTATAGPRRRHVVGEAPGPDRPVAPAGEGPEHAGVADGRLAAGHDLDRRLLRPGGGGRPVGRDVVGAHGPAHDASLRPGGGEGKAAPGPARQ